MIVPLKTLTTSSSSQIRLGEYLIKLGIIRPDQLETALREQHRSHRFLGETLIALNFISGKIFYPILAEFIGFPYVDLETQVTQPNLPPHKSPQFKSFALVDGIMHIATGDPHNIFIRREIAQYYSAHKIFLADPRQVSRCQLHYPKEKNTPPSPTLSLTQDSAISLAQEILNEAIYTRTTDIHFIPSEKTTKISYRIDGVLHERRMLHTPIWQSLKTHLKVLAHLDLSEDRRPQDGSITFHYSGAVVDCRLSFIPTAQGESLVVRLLDQNQVSLNIHELGFIPSQIEHLKQISKQAQGLFIIAGPTGSGKTTTLYSLLQEIIAQQKNIITVEDPIEYKINGIRQAEAREGVNSFPDLLRAMLRHDPDVIYISEIRDAQTAQTAVRAALTGHLVFSTIHASHSCLIPQRLQDLGVSPLDLSGTLIALMSQRLIRKICSSCHSQGCSHCQHSGYFGRSVIAEVLTCDPDFQSICEGGLTWTKLETWRKSLPIARLEDLQNYYLAHHITNITEISRVFGDGVYKAFPRAA